MIDPFCSKGVGGRPPVGLERMQRIHFVQHWFNLADLACEKALYDSASLRHFVGIDLGKNPVLDADIIGTPSSTKNKERKRDLEMHQSRKGQQWYYGMKLHVGGDSQSGLAHHAVVTAANEKRGLPIHLGWGRRLNPIVLESTLTCPECGFAKSETMPTDACQWFYECTHCHAVLKPQPGDCCVYCSYGTSPCPPIQQQGKGNSCCA